MNPYWNDFHRMMSERKKDTLGGHKGPKKVSIFTSSTDLGVARNGGRIGSRYAPQAILSPLLKMGNPNHALGVTTFEVSDSLLEEKDFTYAQEIETEKILKEIELSEKNIHIGGGHDHIYPLLMAINAMAPNKNLSVINIDAHLDTRTDTKPHSGNPFRLFAKERKSSWDLIQIGIHSFANPKSNYEPLPNTKLTIIERDNTRSVTSITEQLKTLVDKNRETPIVISLDADAIAAGEMMGVSAPNHDGLSLSMLHEIMDFIYREYKEQKIYLGIYEYNPLYDNLSATGARSLAAIIYQYMTR